MEIARLFNKIPKDIQVKIAVEYVGEGWVVKKGKLVFDFSYLYDKIPKLKCELSQNTLLQNMYSNMNLNHLQSKTANIEINIKNRKKYTLNVIEVSHDNTYKKLIYFICIYDMVRNRITVIFIKK